MMKWMRQSTCWVESRKLSNKKALSLLLLQPDSGLLFRSGKVQVKHLSMDARQKKYIGVCSNKVLDSDAVGNM